MGIQKYRIYFDSQPVYYSGNTISGRLELGLNSLKKVNGILLTFKGEAKTSWSEDTTTRDSEGKDQTVTTYYTGHESYFHRKFYLTGGQSSTIQIPSGNHIYPFTFTLPHNIPSSFEGQYGYIRYTIKSTLDRPWKFDQTVKAAFTVIAPLDLNMSPILCRPASLILEKTFCCSSGNISVVVRAPYTGYVCGQVIPLTIEVDNASSSDVNGISLKLSKNVTFYTTNRRHHKSYWVTLMKHDFGKNVPAKKANLFFKNIQVPSLPPSNLDNCSIINVSYSFKFKFITSGMHRNLTGNLPITIGTVPIANMVPPTRRPEPMPNPSAPNIPSRTNASAPAQGPNESTGISAIAPPSYDDIEHSYVFDIPPPTYEESQFGTKSILDSDDSKHTMLNSSHYSPMYPVYSFNTVESK